MHTFIRPFQFDFAEFPLMASDLICALVRIELEFSWKIIFRIFDI